MTINLQYITDKKGKKNAVLLPISTWDKIQRDLNEYEKLKDKRIFFEGLAQAYHEVKLVTDGKKNPNSFDNLINEL